jgi:hypothetical protein
MACPFVYKNGKKCTGYIAKMVIDNADGLLEFDKLGWRLELSAPADLRLFCSEKGYHAESKGKGNSPMKVKGLTMGSTNPSCENAENGEILDSPVVWISTFSEPVKDINKSRKARCRA